MVVNLASSGLAPVVSGPENVVKIRLKLLFAVLTENDKTCTKTVWIQN